MAGRNPGFSGAAAQGVPHGGAQLRGCASHEGFQRGGLIVPLRCVANELLNFTFWQPAAARRSCRLVPAAAEVEGAR